MFLGLSMGAASPAAAGADCPNRSIRLLAGFPLVIVTHLSIPAKTLTEFVDYVKKQPDPVNFASAGYGSVTHMTTVLFRLETGSANMPHVPHKGGGSVWPELPAGRAAVYSDTLNSALSFMENGRLRPPGSTSPVRNDALPDVPTIGERGIRTTG